PLPRGPPPPNQRSSPRSRALPWRGPGAPKTPCRRRRSKGSRHHLASLRPYRPSRYLSCQTLPRGGHIFRRAGCRNRGVLLDVAHRRADFLLLVGFEAEALARPADEDARALFRIGSIADVERGAGALEERLGDENA